MAGLVIAFMALGIAASPEALSFHTAVEVPTADVELGRIADLDALPRALRDRADKLVVARLHGQDGPQSFTSRQLAARARSLLPGLSPWLPDRAGPEVQVTRREIAAEVSPAQAIPSRISRRCAQLTRDVTRGAVVVTSDFRGAPCGDISFDARPAYSSGVAVYRRDLPMGTAIELDRASLPDVRPGDELTYRVDVGTVTIERDVEALQPGRAGARIFVRTSDGQVLTMTTPGASR